MLISHRGNLNGPDRRENHPDYIDEAIKLGYSVEVDLRCNDGFYLGHDNSQYEVSRGWLSDRCRHLWIHCKDISSAYIMCDSDMRYFFHVGDPFVIIAGSDNLIWCHDIALSNTKCIIPLMGKQDLEKFTGVYYAICTDYVIYAESLFK